MYTRKVTPLLLWAHCLDRERCIYEFGDDHYDNNDTDVGNDSGRNIDQML